MYSGFRVGDTVSPLRQGPSEGGSGRPISELTPSNLRRNTPKHRTPDKPCRRRAATTKSADASGGKAVREATAEYLKVVFKELPNAQRVETEIGRASCRERV